MAMARVGIVDDSEMVVLRWWRGLLQWMCSPKVSVVAVVVHRRSIPSPLSICFIFYLFSFTLFFPSFWFSLNFFLFFYIVISSFCVCWFAFFIGFKGLMRQTDCYAFTEGVGKWRLRNEAEA